MKVKRILPLVMSLCMVGGVFAGLAGCNNGNGGKGDGGETCTHTYDKPGAYTDKGDGTHNKTCDKCGETVNGGTHDTEGQGGVCSKCGYDPSAGGGSVDTSTPLPADKKIYVVGDSTVCSFNDSYYLPRYGYGTQLAEYLNVTSDQIVNLALSGRSSKSFTFGLDVDDKNKNSISGDKSCYEYLTTNISAGDYLIIGFGHNDEKSDDAVRYTDANGTYDQATTANGDSFAYTLYNYYVKMATDKGATPILCTPIVRYSNKGENGDYSTDKAHDTTTTDKLGKGGNYAKAIRDLGTATNTTVIDLTSLTKVVYESNNAEAQYFHAHTTYSEDRHVPTTGAETPSGRDDTHINKYGAKMVAYQFANALKATDSTLKAHVKDNIAAPTKDVDYADAKNLAYEKPETTAFDPSKYASRNLTGDWYHTVMGNIGGKKASNYTISYSNSIFTVGNPTNGKGGDGDNGKFEGTGEGFGAAFMQIEKSKNFTISATVTVKKISSASNNQSAFGIMLRDDMHIDGEPEGVYDGKTNVTANYVSASITGDGSASMLSREGGTLSKDGGIAVAVNSTYTMSIERTGQAVTVKIGDTTKPINTDFDFFAADNDYMYLCLFANRGLIVEFSNVQFSITGESQGA